MTDDQPTNIERPSQSLINGHLRRTFADRASEELPSDLLSLIDQLRQQDDQNAS